MTARRKEEKQKNNRNQLSRPPENRFARISLGAVKNSASAERGCHDSLARLGRRRILGFFWEHTVWRLRRQGRRGCGSLPQRELPVGFYSVLGGARYCEQRRKGARSAEKARKRKRKRWSGILKLDHQ
jgi:hypothetical protein